MESRRKPCLTCCVRAFVCISESCVCVFSFMYRVRRTPLHPYGWWDFTTGFAQGTANEGNALLYFALWYSEEMVGDLSRYWKDRIGIEKRCVSVPASRVAVLSCVRCSKDRCWYVAMLLSAGLTYCCCTYMALRSSCMKIINRRLLVRSTTTWYHASRGDGQRRINHRWWVWYRTYRMRLRDK